MTLLFHSSWTRITLIASLVLALASSACVRRDGRNSDCRWPGEASRESADPRHLSADAEFAEDLAIRYADTHHGLQTPHYVSGQAYGSARDRCMDQLFGEIAKHHKVAFVQVSDSLGRNRVHIDAAVVLPFLLVYCIAAVAACRILWRRYPPWQNGWIPGAIMAVFVSLAFAGASTMVGEVWSWMAETYRVGNEHLSYRVDRLPWARQRTALFTIALLMFWVTAFLSAKRISR